VFFIAVPASILIGMMVLLATIGVMMNSYTEAIGLFLSQLTGR
jgi:flagellar biosynthesis protein FliR